MRAKSRVLGHAEPKKRGPRYTPQGQRDTIVIRYGGPDGPDGEQDAYHQDADLALVEAQALAMNAEGPVVYNVVRRPIGFGREALLYRIERDEDGAVLTHTVDLED